MTALKLCGAIVHSLRDHPDVTGVVPVESIDYLNRLTLDVTDNDGLIWQVHVLVHPRDGGG